MSQLINLRQTRLREVLAMIGNSANEAGNSVLSKVNNEIAKLFEDRNAMLTGGGLVSFTGTSITFTSALKLVLTQKISGAAPQTIDLASTARTVSADGKMVYAVVNRTAGTAVVTDDATSLPAAIAANQEIFLIAIRVGTFLYFRNGSSLQAGQSTRIGSVGTLFAADFVIADATDTTKKIKFTASGNTTAKTTTLASNSTLDRTLNLPDANDTLVGKATTDVMTNKTLAYLRQSVANDAATGSSTTITSPTTGVVRLTSGSLVSVAGIPAGLSGQSLIIENQTGVAVNINNDDTGATAVDRIYTGSGGPASMLNNSSFMFVYDSTTQRWMLVGGTGSGSGSGSGINYITFGTAEAGTQGWTTYKDVAGAEPVDGTGGAPTTTWTTSTSSPLRGLSSYLLTKDAANRQGEGSSYDFTIDSADQGKVLAGSFDYAINSGTFADGDLTAYIYDVTNNEVIQPAGFTILNVATGFPQRHFFTFQTAINSTSYRLIFHVASTSALAYVIKLDNISVGPQIVQYGAPITDWISYTPVFAASGGGAIGDGTIAGKWRRVGDGIEIQVAMLAGSTTNFGTGAMNISIPAGLTIDSNKLPNIVGADESLGTAEGFDLSTGNRYSGTLLLNSVTTLAFGGANTSGVWVSTTPFAWSNGDSLSLAARVPIVGYSSSVEMSSDTDTRVVAAEIKSTGGIAVGAATNTLITFDTVVKDTHGGYSAGLYTAKVPGWYSMTAQATGANQARTSTERTSLLVYKNGVQYDFLDTRYMHASVTVRQVVGGTYEMYLNAGETISFYYFNNGTDTIDGAYFNIHRLSGPASIAATESIAARYSSNAGQSIPSGGYHIVDFGDKEKDSHLAVTTGASWKFVAPANGEYLIKAFVRIAASAFSPYNTAMAIHKNGILERQLNDTTLDSGAAQAVGTGGSTTVTLKTGEYIDVRVSQTSAGAQSIVDGTAGTYVCINRIGN